MTQLKLAFLELLGSFRLLVGKDYCYRLVFEGHCFCDDAFHTFLLNGVFLPGLRRLDVPAIFDDLPLPREWFGYFNLRLPK